MDVTQLLQAAYKKLKADIFFDKTQLILRNRIVEYECSHNFDHDFKALSSEILSSPDASQKLSEILDSVTYQAFPKTLINNKNPNIIANIEEANVEVDKLQYMIDMEVDGYILGIALVMLAGCFIDREIYDHSYGNRLRDTIFNSNNNQLFEPSFSPYLFEPYFAQYETWRDNALECGQSSLKKHQNIIILMLDFKRYFYSVGITETELSEAVTDHTDNIYINDDEYHTLVKNLTHFIWSVMERYSSIIRETDPLLVDNRCILPIGFAPSNIIANYALSEFDKAIVNELNPLYYGRYVDDIIIVEKVEKNSYIYQKLASGMTSEDIIKYYLCEHILNSETSKDNIAPTDMQTTVSNNTNHDSKNEIAEYSLNPSYNVFLNSKTTLQSQKVNVFYFHSAQSDALLTCFRNTLNRNKSEFRYLPEHESVFLKDDYTEIYDFQEKESPYKLRNIQDIYVNKFALSKYLGKYLRVSELVQDISKTSFDSDIVKIFTNRVAVENYTTWEKVLEILIISGKQDIYLDFIKRINSAISSLRFPHDTIADQVKSSLRAVLFSCTCRTMALASREKKTDLIKKLISISNIWDDDLCWEILDYADWYCLTRMVDKYALPLPIDLFIQEEKNVFNADLYDFQSIKEIAPVKKFYNTQNPYLFYPYMITMSDLSLAFSFVNMHEINNPDNNMPKAYKELINSYYMLNFRFRAINTDDADDSSPNAVKIKKILSDNDRAIQVNDTPLMKQNDKIKVAIANTYIPSSDAVNAIDDIPNRSYARYRAFVKTVNEAIHTHSDMLIFPECYLPYEWLPILSRTCTKNHMAVVTGVEHLKISNNVFNLTAVILPYNDDKYPFSYVYFHRKTHMAPEEDSMIRSRGYTPITGSGHELYCWNNFWFSVYCCYELTSIKDRSKFQSYVDAIISVVYNKDTNYFSSIIDSLARDMHCFCIQVNTSQYGDSRITLPSKTESKDLLKVKGGKNSMVLTDVLDISALRNFQLQGNLSQINDKTNKLNLKLTPPDFNLNIVKNKRDNTLWKNI